MLTKNILQTKLPSFCMKRWYKSRNIISLKERGMFEDVFPDTSIKDIVDITNSGPQTVYAGFDPTAESLHVGNLLILVHLLHWQRGGHQPIALLGGATGCIGDPSGRSTERKELLAVFIEENIRKICGDISRVFQNHEKYFWTEKSALKPIHPVVKLICEMTNFNESVIAMEEFQRK